MWTELRHHYRRQFAELDDRMATGFRSWPWEHRDRMRSLVEDHLARPGKRLRPLFTMLSADLLGDRPGRAVPIAAAIELYHCASLVLDDVQDNTEFRRGGTGVHVRENVSNAINLAGIVRSFSYYPVHEASGVTAEEKLALHHRLDVMATMVPLGQSIDIGWHQGWYDGPGGFPYFEMVRLKTGAAFACGAAGAAVLAGAAPDDWAALGAEAGVVYQLVDDFVDMFGPQQPGTLPADLRSGKPSRPVGLLLETLDDPALARRVRHDLRHGGDRGWILDLMRERTVPELLDAEVRARAAALVAAFERHAVDRDAQRRMAAFVDSCVQSMAS